MVVGGRTFRAASAQRAHCAYWRKRRDFPNEQASPCGKAQVEAKCQILRIWGTTPVAECVTATGRRSNRLWSKHVAMHVEIRTDWDATVVSEASEV